MTALNKREPIDLPTYLSQPKADHIVGKTRIYDKKIADNFIQVREAGKPGARSGVASASSRSFTIMGDCAPPP